MVFRRVGERGKMIEEEEDLDGILEECAKFCLGNEKKVVKTCLVLELKEILL